MKASVEEKVNCLVENYTDIEKANAFDFHVINKAKQILCINNMYTELSKKAYNDGAIINLIRKAQGKKCVRRTYSKSQ